MGSVEAIREPGPYIAVRHVAALFVLFSPTGFDYCDRFRVELAIRW